MKYNQFEKNLVKEYKNTINPKKQKQKRDFRFLLRPRFIISFAVMLFVVFLLIEHLCVYVGNKNIDNYDKNFCTTKEMVMINNEAELNKSVSLNARKSKSTSILSSLFSINFIGCGSNLKGDSMPPLDNSSGSMIEESTNDSFNTNVQVEGIDEADYAKCDGNYIYVKNRTGMYIFNLEGDMVASKTMSGDCFYLYNDKIVVLGHNHVSIYKFDGINIEELKGFLCDEITDSRLIDNNLYLVLANNLIKSEIVYENLYYDGCAVTQTMFSLYKINLDDMTTNTVKLVSGAKAQVYTSLNHIYIAASDSINTSISFFDYELNPIGVFNVNGNVLNQFSMDEYNGYFRVATTYRKSSVTQNILSIFNIEKMELAGKIDEGIGLERHTIKSVRFDKNSCNIVTYASRDPLYEIDCSDPYNPVIVSNYQAPGYSQYLHTFTINEEEYVLGFGFLDDLYTEKISIYKKFDDKTTQIGADFVIGNIKNVDYQIDNYNPIRKDDLTSHHNYFVYNDGEKLYFGLQIGYDLYTIFEIDVTKEIEVVTVYKEYQTNYLPSFRSRLFLVNNKIYITQDSYELIIDEFK